MANINMCSRITHMWSQGWCMWAKMFGEFIIPFIGPGYRVDTRGWLDPTAFIVAHRGAPADDVGRSERMPSPESSP